MCARLKAAATPENSATVVPKLAMSSATMANKVTLRLNFSRMSAARPLPVTAPMRAPISCVTARMGVMSSQQPQHAVAVPRADHRPGGDAAGVVVRGGGDEARAHQGQEDEEAGCARCGA